MMYWQLGEIVDDLKDEEPLLDSILTHMGNMHEKLETFEMSICLYGRAVKVIERLYGTSVFFSTFLVLLILRMDIFVLDGCAAHASKI